jgi:predicted exporter
LSGGLILFCALTLSFGWPKMDASTHAMEPRHSQAYAALNAIKENLGQKQEPLWLVVAGRDETKIAERLAAIKPALDNAVSNHLLTGFTLPDALWPRPQMQSANRATARRLVAESSAMRAAALANGFTEEALGLNAKNPSNVAASRRHDECILADQRRQPVDFEKIAAHDPKAFSPPDFFIRRRGTWMPGCWPRPARRCRRKASGFPVGACWGGRCSM